MTKAEALHELYTIFGYGFYNKRVDEALNMAIKALEQEPIIHCKNCKYWQEWENGAGSCHRSNSIWVGTDYDDYCSFAEPKGSDEE